jgi:serine phosphatase RsbU (regulator of sigma subunit)
VATADGVSQLRATGMPLGAMPGMTYEEHEISLAPGDSLLFHSDGLIEAHNSAGEMFGMPRLQTIVQNSRGSEHLIDECLSALSAFAGSNWEQEDDITLVTLQRLKHVESLGITRLSDVVSMVARRRGARDARSRAVDERSQRCRTRRSI